MDQYKYLEELKQGLLSKHKSDNEVQACMDYAQNLLSHNMPVIFDANHLALLLGMESKVLHAYIWGKENQLYHRVEMPKKQGGTRSLNVPCFTLKIIQRWILDNVLYRMHVSDQAMGFCVGKSIVTNAQSHVGSTVILNMDIKDFFPSITQSNVYSLFRYYGYTKEISFLLAKLCCCNGQLPQGSPASPVISNIMCLKLDKRLSSLARSIHAVYTRYADDITFSGQGNLEKYIGVISQILADEGFTANTKKTRVLRKHQKQEITGLTINENRVCVPKDYKRKLMQEIYYCQKYGYEDHQRHIGDQHRFYKEHLYGKAYYIYMVEPDLGKKLLAELGKINWEV